MKTDARKPPADAAEGTLFLGDDWFDPLETGCGPAFAASSRNSCNQNLPPRLGGTGMNGLGLSRPAETTGRLRRLATGAAIASGS